MSEAKLFQPNTVFLPSQSKRELCTCYADASIDHAVKLLVARGLHRVFVIDNDRKLVSVVSIRDILKTLLNPFMT